jgi:putative nucleotidyltransferase with HDIG domain
MPGKPIRASVTQARDLAEVLLREQPDRWAHTAGVAARAAQIATTVEAADRELLLAAVWLHDIGYSPTLAHSRFHPLDAARYLDRHGWPRRLTGLVAHHSGALFVARELGLDRVLHGYPHEQSAVSDALIYADQTTGPAGEPYTIDQRVSEMLARHGPASVQARVHPDRGPYLLAAAARVEQRLATPAPVPG